LVEYKYVYEENLEDYINRSADRVKKERDEVSQRQSLWTELSYIYGENIKHVLQNNLLLFLQKNSKNYPEIEKIYIDIIEK